MNLTRGVSAMRGAVARKAEEKWGPVGSFAYGVGMSMADFLTQAGATGAGNLTLGIMGSSAAANTTMECVDRGLTNRQALTLGAIAGLAEIVTEKVSLETLLDRTSLSQSAMGYFLKNVLAEGSEEVASDLINWAADVMVSKDRSEWNEAIRGYENQGYSEGEAFGLALKDQAMEMGLSFLGGAISGGVMAGGSVAVNGYLDQASTEKLTLADDATADAIIRDRTAVNFLTRRGGLELTSDMTQEEKRQAVKDAVERAAGKTPGGEEKGFETKEKDGIIEPEGKQEAATQDKDFVSLANEDALEDPEILDIVSRIFNGEDPVITPKEGKSDGEIQSGEGTGGPGALQEVYGESETDVAGGTGSGRGGGRSLGELAVSEGTRLAHDGERGEVSTASEQAAYLELKAKDYNDAVIDRYKSVTGLDVVVSSDEAWETVFGKDSVKKEPAKALGGKIYLPESSHTWGRDQITLALYHEGAHAMEQLGFQPYLDLLDEAGGYIAFGREEVSKLMNALLAHTKVTMDQFINDPTVRKWVYDELCAAISGHISVNQFEGEFNGKNIKLSDFFHSEQEFDQFVDRLKQVQDAFNARGENKKK